MGTIDIQDLIEFVKEEMGDTPEASELLRDAAKEVLEIQAMCRSFKELGIGAFREMAQASCMTLDTIAKEVPISMKRESTP
jgi:hypothetical protein